MDGYVTIGTKLDTDGLDEGLSRLEKSLKNSESKMNSFGKSSGKNFGAGFLLGFSLLTSVITKLLSGFANSIDSAISRVDTMNNFSRVMENLGQSAEDSQQAIDYMSEKLQGLPTTLDAGVSAVQRFTSANNNVKASTQMFLALNNAVLAGGAPMQQQQSALEQLSQAYAKGKPDMMEWRTAMSAMPAQLTQVAKAMGFVNANELGEALRSGTISMDEFMRTLVKMNTESVNGFKTFEEQARTSTGGIQTQIANLKTAFTRGMAEILQAIGQTNITNFFQTIINAIKAVIPYIAAFVKSFIVAITYIGKAISTITSAIGKLFGKGGKSQTKEFSADLSSASVSMGSLGSGAGTTSDNLGKAAKSAKDLKKQLAGFDEMNVLQDTSSASGGGAGGGISGGGIGDLGSLGDIGDFGLGNVEDTIKKINPLLDVFTAGIWGLVAAFGALKLLDIAKKFGLLDEAIKSSTILKIAAGIGLIVAGIVLIIKGVIDYLKDPTWANFAKILGGIALVVAGLALLIAPIPALIAGLVLLIAAIGLAIYKHWDEIKAVLATVGQWIYDNVIAPVIEFFKGFWDGIKAVFSTVVEWVKTNIIQPIIDNVTSFVDSVVSILKTIWSGIKTIFEPVIEFFASIFSTVWENIKITIDNIGQIIKALFTLIKTIIGAIVGWLYDNVIQPIIERITTMFNAIKTGVQITWNFITGVLKAVASWINTNIVQPVANFFKGLWDGIKSGVQSAVDKVKSAFSSVTSFFSNLVSKIVSTFRDLGAKVGNVIGGAFKGAVNGVLGAIERILNTPISVINDLIGVINKVPGISLTKLKSFNLPRLAQGGIINQPGRGVAIGGEAGREGVIPLTDSQQMELLGEAIGRYITINANITNTMNGRVISRELQKINNENDFAFNR